MAQSRWHFRSRTWADELPGEFFVEPDAERRRRLAARAGDGKKALEVDRSGSLAHLERAAKRLKHEKAEDRVLYVPHWDLAKAEAAMRRAGVRGAVSNLCGSQRKRIKTLAR